MQGTEYPPPPSAFYHDTTQVEDEKLAAEAVLRDREAYLRQLYTSFVPMWGRLWEEEEEELEESAFGLEDADATTAVSGDDEEGGGRRRREQEIGRRVGGEDDDSNVDVNDGGNTDGHHGKPQGQGQENNNTDNSNDNGNSNSNGGTQQRPTMWWRGADAPHIWKGPPKAAAAASRKSLPGARFVPAERALLDSLEPQAVSVGRLSREYLALLGLPYESVRDMYEKASAAVVGACVSSRIIAVLFPPPPN